MKCCCFRIVDHLQRRFATADSFRGEFARFKSATGRTTCSELCVHCLEARRKGFNLLLLFREFGLTNLLLLRHLCFQLLHVPGLYARFCIFPHNLAPDFPQYISGKEFEKMKTFIVYDLDSQMPVAVGEQVSAETARYCASVATGIFQANLLAEEIDLEKQITC